MDNKDEIEFRIKNAQNSDDFQCTFSDIVEGYYHGKFFCKNYIEIFLSKYLQILNHDESIKVNIDDDDDIIKIIFNTFNLKEKEV